MNRALILLAVVPFGVSGCAVLSGDTTAYYGDKWDPPEVGSLSSTSEQGNAGGATLTISGSGFGDDVNQVMVQFGDESAEVLEATDGQLTVVVPPGPISGGGVEVRVATATGYAAAAQPYTYELGSLHADQVGAVTVSNYWESCTGGGSSRASRSCAGGAWVGATGTDGTATALNFAYPRFNAEDVAFWISGVTQQSVGGWSVQRPGAFPYTAFLEELHQDIGDITLHNEFWEGTAHCVDLDATAVYRYGGGEPEYPDPVDVFESAEISSTETETGACDDGVLYELDTLQFCTSKDAEGIPTRIYKPDWPVSEDFFSGGGRTDLKPSNITLDAPDAGIVGQPLALPEPIVVYAREGFEDSDGETSELGTVMQLSSCFDDGDGDEDLEDVALRFAWEPTGQDLTTDGVVASHTFVRLSLTYTGYGWLGLNGFPVRATITVPDEHEVDDDGFSNITVPAEVLYQFPSIALPGGFGMADPRDHYGLMFITVERVTEYSLPSELGGNVVFSYATGDFSLVQQAWTNPTELSGCENCMDDDEDGWADELDPDCLEGTEENGINRTYDCNDGQDNDGDGTIDAEDRMCGEGADNNENNCDDEVDNDGDGAVDESDPGCSEGDNEQEIDPLCANGEDDDGDGWEDDEDADCIAGQDENGAIVTECSDGEDNDGDGSVDRADADCDDGADDAEAAADETSAR